jgi:hypothetical protein
VTCAVRIQNGQIKETRLLIRCGKIELDKLDEHSCFIVMCGITFEPATFLHVLFTAANSVLSKNNHGEGEGDGCCSCIIT